MSKPPLHRLKEFSGVSTCSSGDSRSIAFNLIIISKGLKHKASMLLSACNDDIFKKLYYNALDAMRNVLAKEGDLDLSFVHHVGEGSGGVFISIDDHYVLGTLGNAEARVFPHGNDIPRSGVIKGGGYLILADDQLSKRDMKHIASLTGKAVHPSELSKLILRDIGRGSISMAISAIRVPSPRGLIHLRGSKALSCESHKGIVRRNNEDACFALSLSRSGGNYLDRRLQVLCVADGAGGHGYGEVASEEAVIETFIGVSEDIIDVSEGRIANMIGSSILSANQRILKLRRSMRTDMASTLTMAVVEDQSAYFGHVGDSRAYLIDVKSGSIGQLTKDHKLVEEMVERGKITREEAKRHPLRNVITSALGMERPRIDIFMVKDKMSVDKSILLATDGLTELVSDDEIAEIVKAKWHPGLISEGLIDIANKRGGYDNISVSLLTHIR